MTEHDRERDEDRGPEPRGRDGRARLADHEAIERLAGELLPSLIAKLGATGLGELEVREDDWRVRLRRPAEPGGPAYGRRASDRPSRSQPGHAGHGHAPAAVEPHRGTPPGRSMTPVGPGHAGTDTPGAGALPPGVDDAHESYRAVATSPAVGVFQPKADVTAGTKVRAGDRLGVVDVLGMPQAVVAPVDGLVGASLVEPGEAVEYGQELIWIELLPAPRAAHQPGHAAAASHGEGT